MEAPRILNKTLSDYDAGRLRRLEVQHPDLVPVEKTPSGDAENLPTKQPTTETAQPSQGN